MLMHLKKKENVIRQPFALPITIELTAVGTLHSALALHANSC